MINISIFGTGYVGLISGVCLADFGMNVICVDVDEKKVEMLNSGLLPIYEPGLDNYLERNLKAGRISFTSDAKKAVEGSSTIFIAVGTPQKDHGMPDLSYVWQVADAAGKYMNSYKLIVTKSTVPVGTSHEITRIISNALKDRGEAIEFDVASNPEFLREGKALQDFTHPDRIVLGVENERSEKTLKDIYRSLYINETPFLVTNIETSEMIKYASNAFLATKITFINEIANLCEKVGADVQVVANAMGRDGRISPKFLHAGPGYGGSCFPKDTHALVHIGEANGINMSIVRSVIEANEFQKHNVVCKLKETLSDTLAGRTIAVLGLAFKPETDDVRESPAITIIQDLLESGAYIKVYDPEAMDEAKKALSAIEAANPANGSVTYCKHAYDAAEGSDALLLVTEWNEFRNMDLRLLKKLLKKPVFFDTRNVYSKKDMLELGFKYIGTGV